MNPSAYSRRPILCRPGLSNCNSNVFQNFLTEWLMQFRIECESVITKATEAEKSFFKTNVTTFRHCKISLKNFYPTVFYGTGFGPRIKESQYAQNCFNRCNWLSSNLLLVVLDQERLLHKPNWTFSKHPQWFYSKRLMNSFMELVKKESFPAGFKEGKPEFNSHLEALHQLLKQFQTVKPAYGVCPQINNQAVAVPSPTIATPKVAQPSSTPVTVSHYGQPFRRTPLIASNPPFPPINNVVEPREGNNAAENETPRRKCKVFSQSSSRF
uniref:Uncharacterized protein n=1 Tax=Ditylenchus dipsaci TaxID=166011 RepID=A0A915E2Z8_9BILA